MPHTAWFIATPKEWALPETRARFQAIADWLAQDGVPLTRFQPVVGGDAGLTVPTTNRVAYAMKHNVKDTFMDISTRGELGCADSHLKLWAGAAARRRGWTVVFEADATLVPQAPSLGSILGDTGLHPEATLLLLGVLPVRDKAHHDVQVGGGGGGGTGSARVADVTRMWAGSHAYCLRNADAGAWLAAITPLDSQIDVAMWVAHDVGRSPGRIATVVYPVFTAPFVLAGGIHALHIKAGLPPDNGLYIAVMVIFAVLLATVITLAVMLARVTPASAPAWRTPARTRRWEP